MSDKIVHDQHFGTSQYSFDALYAVAAALPTYQPMIYNASSAAGGMLTGSTNGACFGIIQRVTDARIDYIAIRVGGQIAVGRITIPSKEVIVGKLWS